MGGIAGRSAGFGRIGATTQTSLYTPVRLPNAPLVVAGVGASPPRLRRRIAIGVAIVVVAAAAAVVVTLLKARPLPAASSPLQTTTERPRVLDAEAERLDRSAIVAHRRKG
jgi:hypothetical protein